MRILIDHFNLSKKEYKEYHQELVDLTLDELIDLLHIIPHKEDYPDNPIKIITNDFILLKTTDVNVRIVPNITGFRVIPQLRDPFNEEKLHGHKSVEYDINNAGLKLFISKGTNYKTTRRSRYRNLFLNGYLPFINILLIIYTLSIISLNIGIIMSFIVLLILSFFNLIYFIRCTYMKPVQFRELKFDILILNELKPIDISYIILSFSQCFYFIIFTIYSFYLDNSLIQIIYWSILIPSSGFIFQRIIVEIILIIALYLRAKLAKKLIEERVLKKYYDDEIIEKTHYLSLYTLIKSENLIKFGLLSRLIAFITFIFTLVPIISI